MKITKKIITWSKRSFLISLGLFLVTLVFLMQRPSTDTLEYIVLVMLSRISIVALLVTFSIFLSVVLLKFNYKRFSETIASVAKNNTTKTTFGNLFKALSVIFIAVLTTLFAIFKLIFSSSSHQYYDNDDEYNPYSQYDTMSKDYNYTNWEYRYFDED